MRILVLGAGAIGSVFGGFLAKSLNQVVLLGRASHMDAISRHGLQIEGIWGDHHITNLKGYSSLMAIREKEGENFDLLLLTVKSYDTERILREYLKLFPNAAPMVSLQNGLGNLEKISEFVGIDKAIGGRVIFGAEIVAMGIVKVTVYADKVVLGGVKGGVPQEQVVKIANVFSQSGIPSEATDSIVKYIWGKILYNGALNALGSILEVQYGELLKRDATKILMREIVKEAFDVIEKEKVDLFWKEPQEYLEQLFRELIPATYDHFPSMLRDIQQKKRTEIDAINGAIVEKGKEFGLHLPVNQVITNLIKVKERITGLNV